MGRILPKRACDSVGKNTKSKSRPAQLTRDSHCAAANARLIGQLLTAALALGIVLLIILEFFGVHLLQLLGATAINEDQARFLAIKYCLPPANDGGIYKHKQPQSLDRRPRIPTKRLTQPPCYLSLLLRTGVTLSQDEGSLGTRCPHDVSRERGVSGTYVCFMCALFVVVGVLCHWSLVLQRESFGTLFVSTLL